MKNTTKSQPLDAHGEFIVAVSKFIATFIVRVLILGFIGVLVHFFGLKVGLSALAFFFLFV